MHEGICHMHQTCAQVERRSMWCAEEEQSLGGSNVFHPHASAYELPTLQVRSSHACGLPAGGAGDHVVL